MKVPRLNFSFKQFKKNKTKVYISICVHRDIRVRVLNLTRQLEKYDGDIEFKFYPLDGDALIARSRSRVASQFLETDFDILLFLDDDILYDPNDIVKIIKTQVENDLDVIGASYVTKNQTDPHFTFRGLKDDESMVFGKGGCVRQVLFLGTGCMAIRRRVFYGIIEKELTHLCYESTLNFYPFFNPLEIEMNGIWTWLSEDWGFNYKCNEAGYKVWLDTTTKLQHIGDYHYDWNDMVKTPKPNLESVDVIVKIS